MNLDLEFLMKFPKLCLAEVLRDVKVLARFMGEKIDLVHGFSYQNNYFSQKYHFILAFT